MAKQIFKNSRLFAVGTDLTSASNKIELDDQFDEADVTNFGSNGVKEVIAALESASLSASGQWEAGALSKVDDAMWAARGGVGPWTVVPGNTANVGDLAYLTRAVTGSYKLGGQVGDVAPWEAAASSSWPTARGKILHPPGTPRTATGTGTGQQLGAVPNGKNLYVCLHVLSVADQAATLTVAIESAADSGFTTPTTRETFTATSAISGQVAQVAGPITDTYYRAKWTIVGGTTPSFLFVVSAGIA